MTDRKRIVELMHIASGGVMKFDENWIENFMVLLSQENPTLAKEIKKQAVKKLKELEKQNGQDETTIGARR